MGLLAFAQGSALALATAPARVEGWLLADAERLPEAREGVPSFIIADGLWASRSADAPAAFVAVGRLEDSRSETVYAMLGADGWIMELVPLPERYQIHDVAFDGSSQPFLVVTHADPLLETRLIWREGEAWRSRALDFLLGFHAVQVHDGRVTVCGSTTRGLVLVDDALDSGSERVVDGRLWSYACSLPKDGPPSFVAFAPLSLVGEGGANSDGSPNNPGVPPPSHYRWAKAPNWDVVEIDVRHWSGSALATMGQDAILAAYYGGAGERQGSTVYHLHDSRATPLGTWELQSPDLYVHEGVLLLGGSFGERVEVHRVEPFGS